MCKVENNGLHSWIQWLFEITETQFELRGTIMLKNANVRTNINHRFMCCRGNRFHHQFFRKLKLMLT